MEIAIGLYTLAVPLLFDGLGRSFVAAAHVFGESPAVATAARVIMAVLALAPPTLLMGGTLPVLTRFAAAGRSEPGRTAGWLYAANTAGAVLGCFVTGCFLISWLGVIGTNLLAAFIDLGVGIAALAWDRRSVVEADERGTTGESVAVRATGGAALAVATFSGFCGLAYELLWSRSLLAAITDDTTYAFTLMLTAFLAGHALGSCPGGPNGTGSAAGPDLATARYRPDARGRDGPPLAPVAGRAPRPDQSPVVRGGDELLGGSDPVPPGDQPGRLRGGGFPGGELRHGCPPLRRPWAAGGCEHRPALWTQYPGGDRRRHHHHGLADPGPGRKGRSCGWPSRRPSWGRWSSSSGAGDGRAGAPRAAAVAGWATLIAMAGALNHWLRLSDVYARQEPGKLLALVEGSGAAITVHGAIPSTGSSRSTA